MSEQPKNDKAQAPYFSEELRPLVMGPTNPRGIDEQVRRFIIDRGEKNERHAETPRPDRHRGRDYQI